MGLSSGHCYDITSHLNSRFRHYLYMILLCSWSQKCPAASRSKMNGSCRTSLLSFNPSPASINISPWKEAFSVFGNMLTPARSITLNRIPLEY